MANHATEKVLIAFEAWSAGKSLPDALAYAGLPLTSWRKVADLYVPPRINPPPDPAEQERRLNRLRRAKESNKRFQARMVAETWARRAAKIGVNPSIIDVYNVTIESTAKDIYLDDCFLMGKTIGDEIDEPTVLMR